MGISSLFGLSHIATAIGEALKSDSFKSMIEQQVTGLFGIGDSDEAIKAQIIASTHLTSAEKEWYRALDIYVGEGPAKRVREILGAIKLVPIIEKDPKLKKDGTPVLDKDGEVISIIREKLPQFDEDDPRIKFVKNLVEEMQGSIGVTSDVRPSTLSKNDRRKAFEIGKEIYTAIGAFESTFKRSLKRLKEAIGPEVRAGLDAAHTHARESMGVDDFRELARNAKAAGISPAEQYSQMKGIKKPTSPWVVLGGAFGAGFILLIGFGTFFATKM